MKNEKKAIEDGFERLSDVLDVFLANLDKCADNAGDGCFGYEGARSEIKKEG